MRGHADMEVRKREASASRIMVWAVAACLGLALLLRAQDATQTTLQEQREVAPAPSSRMLKAGYVIASANQNLLPKMRASGLNAAWVKFTNFKPDSDDEKALQRIEQWADACGKNEVELWPVVNFAGGQTELESFPDFRREVTLRGVINQHTPCPTDERYWRQVVFPRLLKLAELSQTLTIIRGAVLDLEMYGADHAGYGAPCACEACRHGAGSAEPPVLLDWQRSEVRRICRELEQQVHRINPKFQFAAMHLEEPFAFFEGVALGLGTRDVPVIVAAERTYSIGYTPEVDDTQNRFRKLNAHVRYLGGMWIQEFRSERVAPQLYALGSHGGGFWLYTLGSLATPADRVPEGYRVPDPQPQYWSSFREASDELDRFVALGSSYRSPLEAKFVPSDRTVSLTKRVLEPVSATPPRLPLAGEEIHLRRYNIAFVLLSENETLRFRVRGFPVGKHMTEGQLKVLDPDGRELLSRPVVLGRAEDVELTAKSAGTHWITLNMGPCACQLTVSNPRIVFFAGRHHRLKVHRVARRLYFAVADGQQPVIDVVTEGAKEAVTVKLLNPHGKVAAEKVISGSEQLAADGPSGVWSIVIEPARGGSFQDVSLGLAPPLAPYLSDDPSRLLRDKR